VFEFSKDDPGTEAAVAAHLKSTKEMIAAARKQQQQQARSRLGR
jgi:hypothetical protein